MNIRPFIAFAAALLSVGCAAPPQGNPIAAMEADPQCRPYSGYFQQRSFIGLQDECTRRMGQAYCQRCLVQ
ncbi:hypothetical protein GCM10027034_29620 [Ramlibacter solisilvae]|nr:hypothetical protein [Ramlibacter tataouinensis]